MRNVIRRQLKCLLRSARHILHTRKKRSQSNLNRKSGHKIPVPKRCEVAVFPFQVQCFFCLFSLQSTTLRGLTHKAESPPLCLVCAVHCALQRVQRRQPSCVLVQHSTRPLHSRTQRVAALFLRPLRALVVVKNRADALTTGMPVTHTMSQVQVTTPSGKKKTVGIAQDASEGVLSIVVLGATGDLAKKVT